MSEILTYVISENNALKIRMKKFEQYFVKLVIVALICCFVPESNLHSRKRIRTLKKKSVKISNMVRIK